MKTPFLIGVFCFCLSGLQAQTNITPYTVVARDANSRVWERTTYETAPDGTSVPHKHSYTELGTGLHYRKGNQWVESKEEIKILPQGGAAATQGQHQVYFPSDIYDGIIEVVTPDGKHLKSRPLGLSYYDGRNNVLIAELKHSVGQILPSGNQVIYTNCFTDFAADLVCTYRKGGFESDVVFREQPPKPETFGLSSESSQLEMLTEFFDTLEPEQIQSKAHSLKSKVVSTGPSEEPDTTLRFGAMTMKHGKAFAVDGGSDKPTQTATGKNQSRPAAAEEQIPVSKTWTHIDGRTFLIESVPVTKFRSPLQTLATSTGATATIASANSILRRVSTSRLLPPIRTAQAGTNTMQFAKTEPSPKLGVVLDYNLVLDQYDFTFQSDLTYLVTHEVWLQNVTFEGNTIIKFASPSGVLDCCGNVNCLTDNNRPAIFTSSTDNTVGESVPICSGALSFYVNNYTDAALSYMKVYDEFGTCIDVEGGLGVGESTMFECMDVLSGAHLEFVCGRDYYGLDWHFALDIWPTAKNIQIDLYDWWGFYDHTDWGGPICGYEVSPYPAFNVEFGGDLHDIRVCNLAVGICVSEPDSSIGIRNAQFVNCGTALLMGWGTFYAGNILLTNVDTAFVGAGTAEHITFDRGSHLGAGSAAIRLANSILTGVTDYGTPNITLDHIQKLVSSSGVYKAAGGASYYLATSSSYRNVGTTDIDPDLLSELQTMTTYALEDGGYPDTDTPDLGYHYSLVDSDQDGLPDWWELKWFGNLSQNGTGDYDGDGLSNALEMLAGRNPAAAGAVPDTNNIVSFDVYTPLN